MDGKKLTQISPDTNQKQTHGRKPERKHKSDSETDRKSERTLLMNK
jgi:hypothetical protein